MPDLQQIRGEIDRVDGELVRLILHRQALAGEVAAAKRASGKAVRDPAREEAILNRVGEAAGAEHAEGIRQVFRTLFEVSKARQRRLLRPEGVRRLTVAVAGLGLIGGSFYKASQAAGYTVIGLHHGDDLSALAQADLVFVCLPPEAIVPWLARAAAQFRRGAIVVDIGGVKEDIVRGAAALPKDGWTFVGGHPMAGREVSGFANATADLFVGASMVLTPTPDVPPDALETLRAYFASVGFARTVVTDAAHHDEMIAFTSQLGHVIATAYARDGRVADALGFSAGSYANMTRIATMDSAVWSELYRFNRPALLRVLDGFTERLAEFRAALADDDRPRLIALIEEGAAAKRSDLAARTE